MRIFICMERWGKLSRVAQAGFDSSFLPMEDTLQITCPWNIIRKKWVHDPDWHFQGGAFPHLIWAHSDSEMSQEDLGKNRETLPGLIPSEWTLETIQGHSLPWKVLEIREPPTRTWNTSWFLLARGLAVTGLGLSCVLKGLRVRYPYR